jgi:hypothetical protein
MVEQGHPMVHGFVRLKGRRARRPGLGLETRRQYLRRRAGDLGRYLRLWPRLALEMEEVWLQTRKRSLLEQRVIEELKQLPSSVRGWRRMRVAEIHQAYRRAARALWRRLPQALPKPRVAIPLRVWLWLKRWNPFSHSLTWSRRPLQRFWRECVTHVKRGRLDRIDVSGLAFNAIQELALFVTFASLFFSRLLHRLLARAMLGPDAAS